MSLDLLRDVAKANEQAFWDEADSLDEPTREGVPLDLWRALR